MPEIKCMLEDGCAHGRSAVACPALDQCGAAYVLALAKREGGAEVAARNNPTVSALVAAGLVTRGAPYGRGLDWCRIFAVQSADVPFQRKVARYEDKRPERKRAR